MFDCRVGSSGSKVERRMRQRRHRLAVPAATAIRNSEPGVNEGHRQAAGASCHQRSDGRLTRHSEYLARSLSYVNRPLLPTHFVCKRGPKAP
jgi:hypothetical protein